MRAVRHDRDVQPSFGHQEQALSRCFLDIARGFRYTTPNILVSLPKTMAQNNPGSVLVTGGTGFVGSHLVELLLRRGYEITCLVRDPSRLRWISGLPVRTVRGDCSDPPSLFHAVHGVSVVFHL